MALTSGPISFQRFNVDGALPADVDDRFVAALNRHTFGKLATLEDGTQLGWIGPGHLFENEIVAERIAWGRFALFALRVDKSQVPGNVLKSYVRLEEDMALAASGRDYLSRGQKRDAKEAALLRAQQELKDGAFRRMNSYPLLVDLEHRRVYFASHSRALADHLVRLFTDTFGGVLQVATPEVVARRICSAGGRDHVLDSLTPFRLVKPPTNIDESAGVISTDLDFLGKEFLTWLWYQTDDDGGPLKLRGGDDVAVMIDRTLRLKCDFDVTGTDVITADGPTNLPEARAALAVGKQPTKMGLIVGSPSGEFRLTLDGPRFTVSGLVLPEGEAELDARARVEERFELVADAADLIDALYELFILRRTSREWARDLRRISDWAAGRRSQNAARAASA